MKYSEDLRAGLEEYLIKVARHCRSLPDFAEGMTLLVMGGLAVGLVWDSRIGRISGACRSFASPIFSCWPVS